MRGGVGSGAAGAGAPPRSCASRKCPWDLFSLLLSLVTAPLIPTLRWLSLPEMPPPSIPPLCPFLFAPTQERLDKAFANGVPELTAAMLGEWDLDDDRPIAADLPLAAKVRARAQCMHPPAFALSVVVFRGCSMDSWGRRRCLGVE